MPLKKLKGIDACRQVGVPGRFGIGSRDAGAEGLRILDPKISDFSQKIGYFEQEQKENNRKSEFVY